jgi:hypothetical protein
VERHDIQRIRAFLRDTEADVQAIRFRLLEELDDPTAADEAFRALGEGLVRCDAVVAALERHLFLYEESGDLAPIRHLPDWPPYERETPRWGSARDYEAKWRINPNQEAIAHLRAEYARVRDALVAHGAERARTMSE